MVKEKAKGIDKRLIRRSRKNLKEGEKKKRKRKKRKGKLSTKNCDCMYVYLAWFKARIQI